MGETRYVLDEKADSSDGHRLSFTWFINQALDVHSGLADVGSEPTVVPIQTTHCADDWPVCSPRMKYWMDELQVCHIHFSASCFFPGVPSMLWLPSLFLQRLVPGQGSHTPDPHQLSAWKAWFSSHSLPIIILTCSSWVQTIVPKKEKKSGIGGQNETTERKHGQTIVQHYLKNWRKQRKNWRITEDFRHKLTLFFFFLKFDATEQS